MKTLHVSVANKIATYNKADGVIVCGNDDYKIEFDFDADWDAYETKKARFVSNGKYEDVEFTGNICPVPVMYKTGAVEVGVYIDGENMSTTTGATITCTPSIKCATDKAKPEYIAPAAELILSAADEVTGVKGQVSRNTWDINHMKEQLDVIVPEFGVIEGANEVVTVPEGAKRYAKIVEIHGANAKYAVYEDICDLARNYPKRIISDAGAVLFEMPDDVLSRLPEFGLVGNYIFFEDGKAFYKQTRRADVYNPDLSEGERLDQNIYDQASVVVLAEAVVTDISEYITFDGVIDVIGVVSLTVEMAKSEEDIKNMTNGYEDSNIYRVGKTKFVFEM